MHEEQCSTAEALNDLSSYVMQDSSQHPHPPPLLACMRMKTHWSIIGPRYEMPLYSLLCSTIFTAPKSGCVALLEGDYQRRIAVISVSGQPIPALSTVFHCVCCTLLHFEPRARFTHCCCKVTKILAPAGYQPFSLGTIHCH